MKISYLLQSLAIMVSLGCLASCASSADATQGPGMEPKAQIKESSVQSMGERIDSYVLLKEKIRSAQNANKGGDMLDLANEGLELFPDSDEMLWTKFDAYRRMGFPEKAKGVLDTLLAMKHNPIANYYHSLGDFYTFELRNYKTGLDYYTKQINNEPFNSGWTYKQRAENYGFQGLTDLALGDLKKAAFIAQATGDQNLLQAAEVGKARLGKNAEAQK